MLFASHALSSVERERLERLGELLGTTWTRERAEALTKPDTRRRETDRKPRERLVIPLLPGINPKVLDLISKSFGSSHGIDAPEWYRQDRGEVVEGFELPRDKFLQLANLFTPLIPKTP